jgi:hypothetical protein
MKMFSKSIILATLLFIISGCGASSVRYKSDLTSSLTSSEKATIRLSRPSGFAAKFVATDVNDGMTKIGLLGPGDELVWTREPGYVAINIGIQGNTTHAIIFPVEAGKTYSMITNFHMPSWFWIEPDNFRKEIIVYDLKADGTEGANGIFDGFWKLELKRLSAKGSKGVTN